MDKIEMLHELCKALTEEMETIAEKVRKGGMSAGDLETIDKLAHALKCVKTVLAMSESEEYSYDGGGSSNRGGRSYEGRSYNDGRSYEGRSYARGNQRRDSRGRYSREAGYSYAEDVDEIREKIRVLPEEKRRMLMDEMG